jgi:hypothetical protein
MENDQESIRLKRRSKSSFDIFVLFYVFLNLITFVDIIYFSENFWENHSITYHFIFFTSTFFAFYTFFSVKNNPGFVSIEEKVEDLKDSRKESVEVKEVDNALLQIDKSPDRSKNQNKSNIYDINRKD